VSGPQDTPEQSHPAASGPSASQGGQTVLVAFSNAEEFLDELRERGPNVDGVLRLAFRWHPDASGLPVSDL